MTVPMKQPVQGDIMESVLLKGDLGKLTPDERVRYYNEVCRSLGLNPLTQPFAYVTLNGKLQLYALRACADQLRKINGVSLEIVSRELADDVLTIHVRAKLPDGRCDEDLGAVPFPSTLKGESRANAELKAVTKAKRRATLSICGLGWLDETEVQDIPASAKRPAKPAPNVMLTPPPHDAETGEIIEPEIIGSAAPTLPAEPPAPANTEPPAGVGGEVVAPAWEDYIARWDAMLEEATDARELHASWNSDAHKKMRRQIIWPDPAITGRDELALAQSRVAAKIAELKQTAPA